MAFIHPPGIPVERGKIHEFANAILDDHPHYHDEVAAQAAGLSSVVTPPTFTVAGSFFRAPDDEAPEALRRLDLRYVLHGGMEFTFERPVVAGDVLTAEPGEVKEYDKEGRRGGLMKFVEMETVFRDRSGEIVVRSRSIAIQTAGVVKES